MVTWEKRKIDGVILKELKKHLDERGFLIETFRLDEFPEGLNPVMSYVSYTEPGAVRGPHDHHEQTDIFAFIGPGNFLLKLWDNRKESPTYGSFMTIYAGEDNPLTVVIPAGVVHGYKNISKVSRGAVINYPDRLYKGWGKKEDVDEIRYEELSNNPFDMEN